MRGGDGWAIAAGAIIGACILGVVAHMVPSIDPGPRCKPPCECACGEAAAIVDALENRDLETARAAICSPRAPAQ